MLKEQSALFLDRDGVINQRKKNDYVRSIAEFHFLPHVIEGLQKLQDHFQYVIVVTNQQGVAKGLMSEEEVDEIHAYMKQRLALHQVAIDKVYVSYDAADKRPNTRKPNPDMGHWASRDFPDIDFERSLMVGDTASDMQFGRNLGMKCAWIRSGSPFEEHVSPELYDWAGESLVQLAHEVPFILPKI